MTDLSQEVRDPAKRAEWLIVAQRFGFMCPTTASRLVAALGEIDRLRDAMRLQIGHRLNIPWNEAPQSEVDAWLVALEQVQKIQALPKVRP